MQRSDDELYLECLKRGWIVEDQREAVVELRRRSPGRPLGELLVEAGHLTPEQLAELSLPPVSRGDETALPGVTVDPAELERQLGTVAARVERYALGDELGRGGMGCVLRAEDPVLGRAVALKRIGGAAHSPERAARFVAEARITAQLDHPHIVPVYDLARDEDGQPFYTMKEVRGRTLQAVVAEGNESLPGLLRIFLKACDCVAFAHSRGVLHRDLKPSNMMVGEFGEVLVMDWGLSTMTNDEGRMTNRVPGSGAVGETLDGTVVGTPGYASPEQMAGRPGAIDERTDVYGLGAVLYEVLSGTPPHCVRRGEHPSALAVRIAGQAVEPAGVRAPARGVPRELEAVAARALERDPADRYPGVGALRDDVEAYLDGRLVGAARYSSWQALRKWLARHRYLVRGAIAVGLTGLLFGGYLVQQRHARAVARRKSIEAARARVAQLAPTRLLVQVDEALRDVPVEPERRAEPDPAARQRYAALLAALLELTDRQAALLRLASTEDAGRRAHFSALLRLGRLAEVSTDFALAEQAFRLAGRHSRQEAQDRLAGVARARNARLTRHRRAVRALLDRAEQGVLRSEEQYRAALVELASYRERQTVDLLLAELAQLTDLLRSATRSCLLATAKLRPRERAAGWQPMPGLAQAVDAWLAGQTPGRQSAPLTEAVRKAQRLIELRARWSARKGAAAPSWRAVLALAQRQALLAGGKDRRSVLRLVCEALGQLDDPRGTVDRLGSYLWVEWDELRALPAGRALARLAAGDGRAADVLRELVGLQFGLQRRGRWTPEGKFWRLLGARLPEPTAGGAGGDLSQAEDLLRRGLARRGRGDLAGAQADLDRAVKLARTAPALAARGRVRMERGDLAGALADLDEAVRLDPRRAGTFNLRGMLHETAGRLEPARADFDHAIELDPHLLEAHYNRGRLRRRRGDPAGAIADYNQAIAGDPQFVLAYVGRAVALHDGGKLSESLADLDRALALDPRSSPALRLRAGVRHALRDAAGAALDIENAIRLDPENARAYVVRGMLRRQAGDRPGARADLDRAIHLDPRNADAYLNRGNLRRDLKDTAGALADYTEAINLRPDGAEAYLNRGVVRLEAGDARQALADLERAVELAPRLPQAWLVRSNALIRLGRHTEALAGLDRAIALRPGYAVAHFNRGNLLARLRRTDDAIREWDLALRHNPGLTNAYLNRGITWVKQGKPREAIEDFSAMIRIDPNLAVAWNQRGVARRRVGDLQGALADLDQAIKLQPGYGEGHYNRARVKLALGDERGALADLARAIELMPGRTEPLVERGRVWFKRREHGRAHRDYERAIQIAPRDWRPWFNDALALHGLGRKAEGRQRMERARELAPAGMKARITGYIEQYFGK